MIEDADKDGNFLRALSSAIDDMDSGLVSKCFTTAKWGDSGDLCKDLSLMYILSEWIYDGSSPIINRVSNLPFDKYLTEGGESELKEIFQNEDCAREFETAFEHYEYLGGELPDGFPDPQWVLPEWVKEMRLLATIADPLAWESRLANQFYFWFCLTKEIFYEYFGSWLAEEIHHISVRMPQESILNPGWYKLSPETRKSILTASERPVMDMEVPRHIVTDVSETAREWLVFSYDTEAMDNSNRWWSLYDVEALTAMLILYMASEESKDAGTACTKETGHPA